MAGKTSRGLIAGLATAALVASAQPAHAIVGGTPVLDPAKYPWMVQVQGIQGSSISNCGGSLINSRYVLTAAHCIVRGSRARMVVRLGGVDRKKVLNDPRSDPRSDPRIHTVKRSIINGGYGQRGGMVWNDIALIELNQPVRKSQYVKPISLPTSTAVHKDYETFTVTGWGKLGNNAPQSDTLQEFTERQSQNCYRSKNLNERIHLCGHVGDNKGICSGDSGGPAAKQVGGRWELVGIASAVAGTCAHNGENDYYTRVSTYVNWIKKYTGGLK
ncbi:serine protease [Streptomyces sp. NPDC002851]